MGPLIIRCPGCAAALSSAEAFAAGTLIDCPRCRLLFAPTTEDLKAQHGRAEAVAAEQQWAEADVPRPSPSRSPWDSRRRFRWLTDGELAGVAVATVVMLGLAGAVVGTFLYHLRGSPTPAGRMPAAPAPAASAPWAAGNRAAPVAAAAPVREVEDDGPAAARRRVPALDDDDASDGPLAPPAAASTKPAKPAEPSRRADASLAKRLVGSWEPAPDSPPPAGEVQPFVFEFRDNGQFVVGVRRGLEAGTVRATWRAVSEEGTTLHIRVTAAGFLDDKPDRDGTAMAVRFLSDDRIRLEVTGAGAASSVWQRQARHED